MAERKKGTLKKKRGEENNIIYAAVLVAIVAFVLILIALSSVISKNSDKNGGESDPGTSDDAVISQPSGQADGSNTESGPAATGEATDGTDAESTAAATDGESTASGSDGETDAPPPASDAIEIKPTSESKEQDGSEIKMIYPLLTSAGQSGHTADEINSLIREYMDEERRITCIDSAGDEYEYVIEAADVKYVGKTFFSAVIRGYVYSDGAPYPTVFAYTLNCDTKSCRILEDGDLIKDFGKLRSLFTSGKFKMTEGEDDLLDNTTYEDLMIEYRPEYGIYPSVYYAGSGFGLALETVYSLGGYALFEISIDELGDAVYKPAD